MGWFGYGLYDGDDTQTRHLDFIKWALPSMKLSEEDIFEMLKIKKTKIPNKYIMQFKKGIPLILKKIKTPKKNILFWDDDDLIEWQMLLSLFVDNDLMVPKKILVYGMCASILLLGKHASEFDVPSKRIAALKRFIKKVDENFCSVSARKEISKMVNYERK